MKNSDSLPLSTALAVASLIERLARLMRAEDRAGGFDPVQREVLRYLDRANRFSRNPAALADYLGSTRGTVSQTLNSLAEKGFIDKTPDPRDGRAVALALTDAGRRHLEAGGTRALARALQASADPASVDAALEATLRVLLAGRGGRPFGICQACRHFRGDVGDAASANRCALLDEPLSNDDAKLICAEQEPMTA